VEYGLERGTSANAFLFEGGTGASGQAVPPVLVHPLGASFAAPFLAELEQRLAPDAALKVVVGHVNPNRVELLRQLAAGLVDAGCHHHRQPAAPQQRRDFVEDVRLLVQQQDGQFVVGRVEVASRSGGGFGALHVWHRGECPVRSMAVNSAMQQA
jgi:hypothetical protein